jgi:hypothetical protein
MILAVAVLRVSPFTLAEDADAWSTGWFGSFTRIPSTAPADSITHT